MTSGARSVVQPPLMMNPVGNVSTSWENRAPVQEGLPRRRVAHRQEGVGRHHPGEAVGVLAHQPQADQATPVLAHQRDARQVEHVEQQRPHPLDVAGVGVVGRGPRACPSARTRPGRGPPTAVRPRSAPGSSCGTGSSTTARRAAAAPPRRRPGPRPGSARAADRRRRRPSRRSAARTGSRAGRRTARRGCAGSSCPNRRRSEVMAAAPDRRSGRGARASPACSRRVRMRAVTRRARTTEQPSCSRSTFQASQLVARSRPASRSRRSGRRPPAQLARRTTSRARRGTTPGPRAAARPTRSDRSATRRRGPAHGGDLLVQARPLQHQGVDAAGHRALGRDLRAAGSRHLQLALDHRGQQRLAALEVAEDRALGHAGQGGHVGHGWARSRPP